MSFYRNLGINDQAIKDALINSPELKIVHLIKFERPSQSIGNKDATSYGYFTTSSNPEIFDDGSKDIRGSFNGAQTYLQNKFLKMSDIQEKEMLQNTNVTLTFDATAVGTSLTGTFTFTSSTVTSTHSWKDSGFQEGDIVTFQSNTGINNLVSVRIDVFTNDNKTIQATSVSEATLSTESNSNYSYTASLSSDEIVTFTAGDVSTSFTEYLNRDVSVFRRVYVPTEDGGFSEAGTYLIFKGLIANGKLTENPLKSSTMTWQVSSHWSAFTTVNGRTTSDDTHRALKSNQLTSDFESLKRPEYEQDLGFIHADKAFNVAAKFRTGIEKQETKVKGKWYKSTKSKTRKWIEYTAREQKLAFNLNSSHIPLVYGVQVIEDPINVFADVLNLPIGTVSTGVTHTKFVSAQVLCEGPISSILDIVVEDEPSVCRDFPDFVTRNTNLAPESRTCVGRADRGDVLSGSPFYNRTIVTCSVDSGSVDKVRRFTVDNVEGTLVAGLELDTEGQVRGNIITKVHSQTDIELEFPITLEDNASLTFRTAIGQYNVGNSGQTGTVQDLDYTATGNTINTTNVRMLGIVGTRKLLERWMGHIELGHDGTPSSNRINTISDHGLKTGVPVEYLNKTQGSDISGLVHKGQYFIRYFDANEFYLHNTFQDALHGANTISLGNAGTTGTNLHIFKTVETPITHEHGVSINTSKEQIMFHAGQKYQECNQILSSIANSIEDPSGVKPYKISGTGLSALRQQSLYEVVKADSSVSSTVGSTFKVIDIVSDSVAYVRTPVYGFKIQKTYKSKKPSRYFSRSGTSLVKKTIIGFKGKKLPTLSGISSNNSIRLQLNYEQYAQHIRLIGGAIAAIRGIKVANALRAQNQTPVVITDIDEGTPDLGFKIQHDYYSNSPIPYWSTNHRLLDTAYIVSFKRMESGDANQAIHKYIVKGKFLECYNYDNSFGVLDTSNINSYKIGDSVSIGGGAQQLILTNIVASDFDSTAQKEVHVKHFSNNLTVDAAGDSFKNGSIIYVYNTNNNSLDSSQTIIAGHVHAEDIYTDGSYAYVVHETFLSVYELSTKQLVQRQVMFAYEDELSGSNTGIAGTSTNPGTPRYSRMVAQKKRLVTNISGDGTYVYIYSPKHIAATENDGLHDSVYSVRAAGRGSYQSKYNGAGSSDLLNPGLRYGDMLVPAIYKYKKSDLLVGAKYVENTSTYDNTTEDYSSTHKARYHRQSNDRKHQTTTFFGSEYDDIDNNNNDQTLNPWAGKYSIVFAEQFITQSQNGAIPDKIQTMTAFDNALHCYFDTVHTFVQDNELPKGMTTDGTTLWVADWFTTIGKPSLPDEGDDVYLPGFESDSRTTLSNINELRCFVNDDETKPGVDNYRGLDSTLLFKNFSGNGMIYAYTLSNGNRDASKDIKPYIPTLSASYDVYQKTITAYNNRRRYVGASSFGDITITSGGSVVTLNNLTGIRKGMSIHFSANDTKSYYTGDHMYNKARAINQIYQPVITGITKASETFIFMGEGHNFKEGDRIVIEGGDISELNAVNNERLYDTPFTVVDVASTSFKIQDDAGNYIDSSGYSGTTSSGAKAVIAKPLYLTNSFLGSSHGATIIRMDNTTNQVLLDRFLIVPDVASGVTVDIGYNFKNHTRYQLPYNDINYMYRYTSETDGDFHTQGALTALQDDRYHSYDSSYKIGGRLNALNPDNVYDISHHVINGVNYMCMLNKHREHIAINTLDTSINTALNAGSTNTTTGNWISEKVSGSHVFFYNMDTGRMFTKAISVPTGTVGICTYSYDDDRDLNGNTGGQANNPTFLYCLVEHNDNPSKNLEYTIRTYLLDFENTHSGNSLSFGRPEIDINGNCLMTGYPYNANNTNEIASGDAELGWRRNSQGTTRFRDEDFSMPPYNRDLYADSRYEFAHDYTNRTYGIHSNFDTNITAEVGGLSSAANSTRLHGLSIVPGNTYNAVVGSPIPMPVLATTARDNDGTAVILTNSTTASKKFFSRTGVTQGTDRSNMAGLAIVASGGANRYLVIENADYNCTQRPIARKDPFVTAYTEGTNALATYTSFGASGTIQLGEPRSATSKTSVMTQLTAPDDAATTNANAPFLRTFDFAPVTDADTSLPINYSGSFQLDGDSVIFVAGNLFHEYDETATSLTRSGDGEDLHTTPPSISGVTITDISKEDSFSGAAGAYRISLDSNFEKGEVDSYTITTDGSSNPLILASNLITPSASSTQLVQGSGQSTQISNGSFGWTSKGQDISFSTHVSSSVIGLNLNEDLLNYSHPTDINRNKFFFGVAEESFFRPFGITGTIDTAPLDNLRAKVAWDQCRNLKLQGELPYRAQLAQLTMYNVAGTYDELYAMVVDSVLDITPEMWDSASYPFVYRHNTEDSVVTALINGAVNGEGVDEFFNIDTTANVLSTGRTYPKVGDQFLYDGMPPEEIIYVTAVGTLSDSSTNTIKLTKDITVANDTEVTFITHSHVLLGCKAMEGYKKANDTAKAQMLAGEGLNLEWTDIVEFDRKAHPSKATSDSLVNVSFRNDELEGFSEPEKGLYNIGGIAKSLHTTKLFAYDFTTGLGIIDMDNTFIQDNHTQFKFFDENIKDLRVSNNPAMQLLDYLTDTKYGKGLKLNFTFDSETGQRKVDEQNSDIDFDSFIEAARLCDARSQVTVCMPADTIATVAAGTSNSSTLTLKNNQGDPIRVGDLVLHNNISTEITVTNPDRTGAADQRDIELSANASLPINSTVILRARPPVVGDTYKYFFGGNTLSASESAGAKLLFQGTVEKVSFRLATTRQGDLKGFYEITFDEVIGSLGKKHNTWKDFNEDLVYINNNVHLVGTTGGLSSTYTAVETEAFNKLTADGLRLYRSATNPNDTTSTRHSASIPIRLNIGTDIVHAHFAENATKASGSAFAMGEIDGQLEVGMYATLTDTGGVSRIVTIESIDESANSIVLTFPGGANLDVENTAAEDTGNTHYYVQFSSESVDNNLISVDGNPIVKSFESNSSTFQNSGYSLYDADHVKYWRYVGWSEQDQRYASRHQLNCLIDTGNTLFENTFDILSQFNGTLTFTSGKYSLDVKRRQDKDVTGSTAQPALTGVPTSDVSKISEEDIIGKITIDDRGVKTSFNSIDATVADPSMQFEGRQISFFNSTYLEQDNNIPKKGSYASPYISNYFNARINVKQYLDMSRLSLIIGFTMAPKGAMLKAGSIIKISYARFNFTEKLFRISDITLKTNGLVDIVAQEHSDDTYLLEKVNATDTKLIRGRCVSGTEVTVPLPLNFNPDNV